jgi:hypothetical protein
VAKLTAPVKAMQPKEETLRRLLKEELYKCIQAIGPVCETDHYGQVVIYDVDTYEVKPLLRLIDKKYTDLLAKKIGANEYLRTA